MVDVVPGLADTGPWAVVEADGQDTLLACGCRGDCYTAWCPLRLHLTMLDWMHATGECQFLQLKAVVEQVVDEDRNVMIAGMTADAHGAACFG